MKRKIKVMLVEDHPEYRNVIKLALENEPDMEMTGQFGSSERALRSLQSIKAPPAPDLVLLDLNLPQMSGLDALPWFKKYAPQTKIIILSQSNKEADIYCAIQRGASGYLLKSASIKEITGAIRSVAAGKAILDPGLAKFILNVIRDKPAKQSIPKELSSREVEILTLLGEGLIQKQIAVQLKISTNTVAKHMVHIYEKLEVQNAPAAIHKAHNAGIL